MRIRMMNLFVVAAVCSAALMGCKGGGGSADAGGDATLVEPVIIVERVNGSSDALKTIATMHLETQADYDALGDANLFPGPIDFDTYDLVVVALGERSTGGFGINIESIQLDGGELAVTGKASAPGPDAIVTQALTYPYSAVLIANTSADKVVPYID